MPHANASFPRSGVLVLGSNSIQSLVPSTLISQAEALLESHRIEDAIDLADQQRKKIHSSISVDEDQAEELRYVYQRIGFQCFTETLFEDAGKNFTNGDLDPRLLISYYPDLRGSMFTAQDSMDVFAGVAEHMPSESSVDDIIRNYSPHLSPDTRSAPPTAELRRILGEAAHEMLEVYLRKCRTRRKVDGQSGSGSPLQASYAIVDTVLAKLFAQSEKTKDLYNMVEEANDIILAEVEPVLTKTGQYNALCILYRQRGDDEKLLEAWSKIVEGEWSEQDIKDPIDDMITLLTEKKDRALTQKWGIWLTKQDPERGLKLLTSKDSTKRRDRGEDEETLLAQIQESSPAAAAQYLEHLVLTKRNQSRTLHTRYATSCIDQLLIFLGQDSVSKLWRAKASSYASSRTESSSSFLSYFAATTPDSEHKRVRLKTALFLQVSSLYDLQAVKDLLSPHQKILKLEMAIIYGKLGNHREALSFLAHDMRDSISAETYCTLGGEVIPRKVAMSIIEQSPGLLPLQRMWLSTASDGQPGSGVNMATTRSRDVDEKTKKGMLKLLLEVYMSDKDASADRAAHLLDSQAINLDALDVISLVPPDWSLNLVSSFLARSFRRTLHQRHEGQILKTISAGQNLEVKERTWLILREEGMVVEEPLDGDGDATDDDENEHEKLEVFDEKGTLAIDSAVDVSSHVKEREDWRGRDVLDVR